MSSSVLPSVLTSPSAPSGRIALATVAGLVVGGGLTLLLQRVFDDYYCGGGEATAAVENRRSRHRRRHQRPTAAITQGHDEDIRDIVERIVSLQDEESVIAKLNDKPEKCKQLIIRAKDHAFAALKLDETDCQVHKWCAITIGSVGDFETTSIRIKNGFKFKEHIDEAIRLCPKDAEAHHLQGRWCYEVAQLSWIERKAAATLFANPPTATVAEALRCFVKSETLKPNEDICNQLYLGKCYIYKAEYKNSVEWLKKAQNIASKGLEDNSYKEQVDKLLYKYESYA